MSTNPWPIKPPTAKDLDFAVVDYGFSSLTANALADEPSTEAAIDAGLAEFSTSIADQIPLITSLFDGLDDLFAIPGEIDRSAPDRVLGELAQAATDGDKLLSDYTALVGTSSTPTPTPTPASNCVTQDFGTIKLGTTKTIQGSIRNNGQSPFTIKDIIITGNNGPNIFISAPNYQNRSLQPGESIPLNINGDPDGSPEGEKFSSTLTIHTDQPNPQPCVLLLAIAGPGTPGSPGGGGGSGGNGGGGTCHLAIEGGQVKCIF